MSSYTTSFLVARSPQLVFDTITNVRAWWDGEITGVADHLGAQFTYRHRDLHRSTQTVSVWVPGERIVWKVNDAQLTFVENQAEWNGTEIVFEIEAKGDHTELRFTHRGLTPACQCFRGCAEGWSFFITERLRRVISEAK